MFKVAQRGRPKGNSGQKKLKAAPDNKRKKQKIDNVLAVLCFAITLLLIFSVYINLCGAFGDFVRKILLSVFGVIAFALPALTAWLGFDLLNPNRKFSSRAKLLTGFGLAAVLCSFCYLFMPNSFFGQFGFVTFFSDGFTKFIETGVSLNSGGLLGGIIAYPLIMLLRKVGFAIVCLAVGLILIITFFDITLYQLFYPIIKLFRKEDKPDDADKVLKPKLVRKPKMDDIDIPVDDANESFEHIEPDEQPSSDINIPIFVHDDIDSTQYITSADDIGETEMHQNNIDPEPNFTEPDFDIPKPTSGKQSSLYTTPPFSLLEVPKQAVGTSRAEIAKTEKKLLETLSNFGVETTMLGTSVGPNVTRYELAPKVGVRVNKITSLADDIALSLAATQIRIEAPIPGKAAIGIEIPNKTTSMVYIRELLESREFAAAKSPLTVALGKDISGRMVLCDLSKMPHLLIAGATGSGKSVCLNSLLISLLYKASPEEVKLILIDPKVVELGIYNSIPHLFIPVVNDSKKAAGALQWAASEMDRRYNLFKDALVRDIDGFNEYAQKHPDKFEVQPKIVVVIDELADLMMVAAKEVEDHIVRLCQKARAAGIFLVIATQRPSVNVVTGLIKANVPSRIAFAVASQIDSRVILDGSGAEKLLGRGDMLFKPVGANKPQRVQGCYVSDHEVEAVVEYIRQSTNEVQYDEQAIEQIEKLTKQTGNTAAAQEDGSEPMDEMLYPAIECVIETGQASTSYLQRKLKLGYARAARIVDTMEEMGVVGPFEGSKPRQVLMTMDQYHEMRVQRGD